jgi:hypothetical protein
MGPSAALDTMEKRKILPLLEIEPQLSSPQLVAASTELSRI